MNAKTVNLRTARKRKARTAEKAAADENARSHGRSRAERTLTRARNDLETARIEAHRLDRADDE